MLTPGEAPPLAAALRAHANAPRIEPDLEVEAAVDPTAGEPHPRIIWYEDSAMLQRHRELVKAGMAQTRQEGKHIGRPKATEREGFPEHLAGALARLETGELSRRRAAQELDIGYATLTRLLDARMQCANEEVALTSRVAGQLVDSNPGGEHLDPLIVICNEGDKVSETQG